MTTDADRQWALDAVARAKAALKIGDRITFTSCPGTKRWAVVTGWDGNWITSATRDDISPTSISKVNGKPMSFADGIRPSRRGVAS